MAEKQKEAPPGGDTVARGDHTSVALEGSYRDNPDKPAVESVAQVQDVPEGWPGGPHADAPKAKAETKDK